MSRTQLPQSSAAPLVQEADRFRTLIKASWGDAWQPVSYLQPISATLAVSPNDSSAELVFDAGEIKREDATSFAIEDPLDLIDHWVLIERIGSASQQTAITPLWVGIFTEESFAQDNPTTDSGGSARPSGEQIVTAFGAEHVLDRVPIRGSIVENVTKGTKHHIDVPLPFNKKDTNGFFDLGNRSSSKFQSPFANRSAYVFSDGGDGSAAAIWTHKDIAEYLLLFWMPGSQASFGDLELRLDGQLDELDKLVSPALDLSGRTLRQALDALIDRRRGLGWMLRYDPSTRGGSTSETMAVHVFTVTDEDVSGGGETLAANPESAEVELDDELDLEEVVITTDVAARYDKVVVWGERIRVMCSVSYADGTLERLWNDSEETAYKDGSTKSGATAADHDQARERDALAHVWAHYRIPRDWNWLAGDGEGGAKNNANFGVTADGELETLGTFGAVQFLYLLFISNIQPGIRDWGHRVLRQIPKRAGRAVASEDETYRSPFVVVQDAEGKWHYAEQIEEGAADVRPLDSDFGLQIRASPPHRWAKNHWSGAAGTEHDPVVDWQEAIATVAAETDTRLRVLELITSKPGDRPSRELHVEVEDAHLWHDVGGTVEDIADDGSLKRSSGGVIRNDAPRLRAVAAFARAWYGRDRRAVRFRRAGLRDDTRPGSFLEAVTDGWRRKDVASLVSSVTWDFARQTTRIETEWRDVDLGSIF